MTDNDVTLAALLADMPASRRAAIIRAMANQLHPNDALAIYAELRASLRMSHGGAILGHFPREAADAS